MESGKKAPETQYLKGARKHTHSTATTSIERVLDSARARGLKVRQLHADDYMVQCPVHEPDNNPSVHVTYRPGEACTTISDQHDNTDKGLTLEILQALGLEWADLYDNPKKRDTNPRRWDNPTGGSPRALADTSHGRTAKTPAMPRAKRFTLPTAYVPDTARGELSEAFRAVCERLGVTPAYGPMMAACPVCNEVGTLRVLYAPLQHAVLFRCRSCDGGGDYATRLASALQISTARVGSNGMEVMAYDNPQGVRYEYSDGLRVSRSPSKQIRQHGTTKGKHPLWLADRVAEYAGAGSPVFMVEGEKDAASLWACGYAATTAAGGGGNLARTLDPENVRAVLSGATVIAVVDKDKTGDEWRSQVAALLHPVVKSLTFVQATGTAHDTTDAIMANTPGEWFEPSPTPAEVEAERRRTEGVTYEDAQQDPPTKFLWPGVFPLNGFTLVYGEGGTFKSPFMRKIAAMVSVGKLPGEFHGKPKTVVIVSTNEDTPRQVFAQIRQMGGDVRRVRVFSTAEGGDTLALASAFIERHADVIGLCVIDPASSFSEDINDAKKVEAFITELNNLAYRANIAIAGIGHCNKITGNPAKAWTGSQKWNDTARARVCIARNPNDEQDAPYSYGKVLKINGAKPGTKFVIQGGFFSPEGDEWANDPAKYESTPDMPVLVAYEPRQTLPYVAKIDATSIDLESFDRNEQVSDLDRMEEGDDRERVEDWISGQPGCEASRKALEKEFTGEGKPFTIAKLKRLLQGNPHLSFRREAKRGGGTIWYVKRLTGGLDAGTAHVQGEPDSGPFTRLTQRTMSQVKPNDSNTQLTRLTQRTDTPGQATDTAHLDATPSLEPSKPSKPTIENTGVYSAHNEPSKPSNEPSSEPGNGPGKPTGALADDLETRFHDLPTYPTGLDFETMPTGLLRMIRDRKPGLWNLKATETLKTRERATGTTAPADR